ncbi:hypothetical protein U9R90_18015 [Streptomyces sp. E11-3]|uniref:hypothetical protein n=1 Tax=Streptomyces sp. E11-3 TaxID=3110112 RepID=UPI00397FAA2A
MNDLNDAHRREAALEIITAARGKALPLTEADLEPSDIPAACKEAQNALRAARESADSAIIFGSVINRVLKISQGVTVRGNWSVQAQDSLRAAVLFAGAGLDRALKVLMQDAIPVLVEHDEQTLKKFKSFAAGAISRKGEDVVDPATLVEMFLASGDSPRDVLRKRWIKELTDGSAQSVERVDEIAAALGVTDTTIRKRIDPSNRRSTLRDAFAARNEIAHELDITKPKADVREKLEKIRKTRKAEDVKKHVTEMLETAHAIIDDVSKRVAEG